MAVDFSMALRGSETEPPPGNLFLAGNFAPACETAHTDLGVTGEIPHELEGRFNPDRPESNRASARRGLPLVHGCRHGPRPAVGWGTRALVSEPSRGKRTRSGRA